MIAERKGRTSMPIRKDQELLSRMLSTPIIEQRQAVTPMPEPPQPVALQPAQPAPRAPMPTGPSPIPPPTIVRGLYRRVGTTLALVGAAAVGSLIWYYSGIFTLSFLGTTFRDMAHLIEASPWWQVWLIPLAISAMELFLWPRRERRPGIFAIRLLLWLLMLAFDVLTTARGMLTILQTQDVVLPITPSERQWIEYGLALAIGMAFAYLPERIARWVLTDLWAIWLAPIWRWFKRLLDSRGASA